MANIQPKEKTAKENAEKFKQTATDNTADIPDDILAKWANGENKIGLDTPGYRRTHRPPTPTPTADVAAAVSSDMSNIVTALTADDMKSYRRWWEITITVRWEFPPTARPLNADTSAEYCTDNPWLSRETWQQWTSELLRETREDARTAAVAMIPIDFQQVGFDDYADYVSRTQLPTDLGDELHRQAIMSMRTEAVQRRQALLGGLTIRMAIAFRSPAKCQQVQTRVDEWTAAATRTVGYPMRASHATATHAANLADNYVTDYVLPTAEQAAKQTREQTRQLVDSIAERLSDGVISFDALVEKKYCSGAIFNRNRKLFTDAATQWQERLANRLKTALTNGTARRQSVFVMADPSHDGNTSDVGKSWLIRRLAESLGKYAVGKLGKGALDDYHGEPQLWLDEVDMSTAEQCDTWKQLGEREYPQPINSRYHNRTSMALVNWVAVSIPWHSTEDIPGLYDRARGAFHADLWQLWKRADYCVFIRMHGDDADTAPRTYSIAKPVRTFGNVSHCEWRVVSDGLTMEQLQASDMMAELRQTVKQALDI